MMNITKKILAILLSLSIILTGCGAQQNQSHSKESVKTPESVVSVDTSALAESFTASDPAEDVSAFKDASLNDPDLLRYLEDSAYQQLVASLHNTDYFVENVQAIYISNEYIQELEYNSRANIFFGYTLSELNKQFQGTKYVFTLGPDGQTIVRELEVFTDDTNLQIIKNVAIGSGVILLCVTVSIVSGGAGAPAACAIFAASAKTGAIMALSGGLLGGVSAGIVKGIQTHDMDQALKATALAGSEGFKWGAISGALIGGSQEAVALKGATMNGLSMNNAALIQKETGLPLGFIKNLHSYEEYLIYKEAGLSPERIGGLLAYSRTIDLKTIITDQYGKTMSNADRILNGWSPVDANGIPYELHHIGQQPDSPLAILTKAEHMQGGNNKILHFRESSDVDHGSEWTKQVRSFWENYLKTHQ